MDEASNEIKGIQDVCSIQKILRTIVRNLLELDVTHINCAHSLEYGQSNIGSKRLLNLHEDFNILRDVLTYEDDDQESGIELPSIFGEVVRDDVSQNGLLIQCFVSLFNRF